MAKNAAAAATVSGSDDKAARDAAQAKSEALSAQSDAEFLRCFADKAPQQAAFRGASKAAQALIDRLPQE